MQSYTIPSANQSSWLIQTPQMEAWRILVSCSFPVTPGHRDMLRYARALLSLCAGTGQSCVRRQVQAMQVLSRCVVVYAPTWLMSEVAWCQNNAGCSASIWDIASRHKRPSGLTWKAMCFCMPCAKKIFNVPTACFFRCNMLFQGRVSVGESSYIKTPFCKMPVGQLCCRK